MSLSSRSFSPSELDEEEKKEFLLELGQNESGLDKLIRAGYKLLG